MLVGRNTDIITKSIKTFLIHFGPFFIGITIGSICIDVTLKLFQIQPRNLEMFNIYYVTYRVDKFLNFFTFFGSLTFISKFRLTE